MIKVRLTARSLAKQLPDLRFDIFALYDGDDDLYLTADLNDTPSSVSGSKEERYPILLKYPSFIESLSTKELQIVNFMYHNERTLADIEWEMWGNNTVFSNRCAVHVKNIRAKIVRLHLPITISKVGHRPTFFSIVDL